MKIDLMHYAVPPVVGGVESVIGHHSRLMSQDGHSVRLLAARGKQMDNGIPVYRIPLADSKHKQILNLKTKLDNGEVTQEFHQTVDLLEKILQDLIQASDILIAHNICSLNKNLALTTAIHRIHTSGHAPHLILWHHDLAWTTPRYRNELHKGYPWDLLRTDWPGATQVVVSKVRQSELAELTGISISNIHVVPNGIDLENFMKFSPMTKMIISQSGLLSGEPIVLLPVRITPRKNIEFALRIIYFLQTAFPQVRLVVSGPPGPHNQANLQYMDMLHVLRSELGLNQNVIFLADMTKEYIPDEVISDFYKLADALIITSREEGFGIPMLEAGISGIPIFCSSIPTLQEVGGNWVTYFSLEDEPASISASIIDLLQNNKFVGFKENVRMNYSWKSIYQERISPMLRL